MKITFFLIGLFFSFPLFSQKQLALFKNGRVKTTFKEGEYIRFILKKNHRHAEGHIVELNDFSMITSNDTVKFKDILKINVRHHRGGISWSTGVGGFLFLGGLLYTAVDQLNVAIKVNAQDNAVGQWAVPLGISAIGAAMVFIHPRYEQLNGIQYLQTLDYTSPFYQR